MENKLNLALFLALFTPAILFAAPNFSQPPADGAKPCSFDDIPHPRVLVTEQRLDFLRSDIKTNAVRRAIYEKDVKANADRWLHRTIVIPAQGGWAHFFCGPDGALLELPADQQFDPNKPSRSPTTGKYYISPRILIARRFFEHEWLTFAARDLALTYAVSRDREYADKAAEILLKYTDAYPHLAAETNGFGYMENSLNESVSIIPLAQAYDLIYNSGALSDEQKRHIEQDFFWPEAQRISQAGLGGNWGSWQLSAVGVIGFATGHQRFANYGIDSFKSQISNQLGDDGLWPESIQTYHFYPLDAFLSFAEAASNCGTNLFDWQAKPGKGLEAMFESPLRYMYPTLQLPAINDGWYNAFLPEDQYAVAYWHYHRPEFAWALQRSEQVGRSGVTGDFYDQRYRLFLFGEPLPAAIPAPVFTSTNFPGLGIAILRQGSDLPVDKEMFLTFHYGPFRGHGHFDKMGITLFANGRPLAPGLGTPAYGSPIYHFFQEVTGHNTIAADEKNQPHTTNNDLVAFLDDPQLKLAAAETRQSPPGTKWIRAVLLADDYAVIWDNLSPITDENQNLTQGAGLSNKSPRPNAVPSPLPSDGRGEGQGEVRVRPHTYDWFFHAFGDQLDLSGTTPPRPANTRKHGEFPYPFITDVSAQQLTGQSAEANWLLPHKTGLKVWLMGETNDVLFTARCPTTDGKTIPMIVLRKKSAECQFVSVLQPWKKKPVKIQITTDNSTPGLLRLTIRQPSRTDVISFETTGIKFAFDNGSPHEKVLDVPFGK